MSGNCNDGTDAFSLTSGKSTEHPALWSWIGNSCPQTTLGFQAFKKRHCEEIGVTLTIEASSVGLSRNHWQLIVLSACAPSTHQKWTSVCSVRDCQRLKQEFVIFGEKIPSMPRVTITTTRPIIVQLRWPNRGDWQVPRRQSHTRTPFS